MKKKKIFAALCVSVVLLSLFAGLIPAEMSCDVHAEEGVLEESKETKELAVPQNLREEDGFIVWDEAEGAYGYYLRVYKEDFEDQYTYYVNRVELDRLCYEQKMDFGDYRFEVCSFDESSTVSEWSNPLTATYVPALETPANVRLSEEKAETILWDAVKGAVRYNVRVFCDNDDRTLYTSVSLYTYEIFSWGNNAAPSGNYWIAIQAVDKDYNASQWTEPILFSHSRPTPSGRLDAPKNLRLDESGENLLWDEVEGATSYAWHICSDGGRYSKEWYHRTEYYMSDLKEPQCNNWKSFVSPFREGEVTIVVGGKNGNAIGTSRSITVPFHPLCDETIGVPDSIRFENGNFDWDDVPGASGYWLCVLADGAAITECDIPVERQCGESHAYVFSNNVLPAGIYGVALAVVDQNGNYNSKTYSFACSSVSDETVWVPEPFYKYETILWDYDRLRHPSSCFWIRLKKGDVVVQLNQIGLPPYEFPDLPNGDYTVEVCACEVGRKIGAWSEPLKISKHDGGLFDKENEVSTETEPSPGDEKIPEEDRITSITINPAFNMKHKDGDDVQLDLTKIKIKAKEIYDEEGLKRASEALGEEIKGNKHYNLLDLTLLYGDEDFSNGYDGLVQVIIPLPAGHRDKTFSCYRLTEVDGKMTKELIPGEQTEDSYIIYLEHFSEYALIGDGGEPEHTHTYSDGFRTDESSHWKECECGEKSEDAKHTFGTWVITKDATENEEGSRERSCEVCGFKQRECVPKLTPVTPTEPSEPATPSMPTETLEPDTPSTPSEPSAPSESEKKPVEFENSDTGIRVTAPADAFDDTDDVKFNAVPIAEKTRDNQFAFDLTFTGKDGNKLWPKTAVTVKIPVPEALKGRMIYVYHVEDNGAYTEINGEVDNGMVVFTASRFSTYIITGEKLNAEPVSTATKTPTVSGTIRISPKTGDNSGTGIAVLGFLFVASASVAVVVSKKRKQL